MSSESNELGHEAAAREAMEHLYRLLLAAPKFTLSSGIEASVEKFSEPHVGRDGRLTCGIDVSLGDGGHLEFHLRSTGWGLAIRLPRLLGRKSPGRSGC